MLTDLVQVGMIPILDKFLDKNPLKAFMERHGLLKQTSTVANFAQKQMGRRVGRPASKSSGGPPDLLSRLLTAQSQNPNSMTMNHVLAMTTSLVFAGSDSTASSLSSVFYCLMRNPTAMQKLRAELDSANLSELPTWAETNVLPYLSACIKESMRLYPAAGLILERIVPKGGAEIAGQWIPGGTIVGCNAWVIHRRKEVFGDDIESFQPERWLEAPEEKKRDMEGALFQFGMGSRTCVGKHISLLEIYKLVPALLNKFEVRGPLFTWCLPS